MDDGVEYYDLIMLQCEMSRSQIAESGTRWPRLFRAVFRAAFGDSRCSSIYEAEECV